MRIVYFLDNVVTLNEMYAMSSALPLSRGRAPEASTKETGEFRIHQRVASGIASLEVSMPFLLSPHGHIVFVQCAAQGNAVQRLV
jgi:hypothetical protein